MTNFSGGSLSQALNGRKGPFFAFLAKFNVKASRQKSTLSLWRNNAESLYDKLNFADVYGHRSCIKRRRAMLCHCRALGLAIHGVYLPSAATTERCPPF
jgi:hypothetical protein